MSESNVPVDNQTPIHCVCCAVERLKIDMIDYRRGAVFMTKQIQDLRAENALLRKVADAAREFISSTGCNPKECKKCDPKYINFCERSGIGRALTELDKEES